MSSDNDAYQDTRAALALAHVRTARTLLALHDTSLQRRVAAQLSRASLLTMCLEAIATFLVVAGVYMWFWHAYPPTYVQHDFPWVAIGAGLALGAIGLLELKRFSPLRAAFQRFAVVLDRSRLAQEELATAETQLEAALNAFHTREEVEQSVASS
jgi:hypothetical protein